MPLLVPPTGVDPQPPWQGAPWPTLINQMPQVSFTDPAGTVTKLSDWENGWLLQPGAKGLDMPAYAFLQDESPGIDGYALRDVRAQGKEIILPVAFWANDSRTAYKARRRTLINSLNPKRGVGALTLTEPDGATRSIGAYYTGGLEGDESLDAAGERWCITALTFGCPSPYWTGEEITRDWKSQVDALFFPILPLAVGASEVLGAVTVDNPGDDIAYPVWTVTGPATQINLVNNTTGQLLVITHTLLAGDIVTIDTRERRQTALLNGGTNLWPDISTASTLWTLGEGNNDLTLTVSGSTATTSVHLAYQPRYLGA